MAVTFTWIPDVGASADRAPVVNSAKFGDGYEQRTPNGLNTLPGIWNLTFSSRNYTEIDAIEAFLADRDGALNFQWTPPRSASVLLFICRKWSRTIGNGPLDSLTATFEQVFDSSANA